MSFLSIVGELAENARKALSDSVSTIVQQPISEGIRKARVPVLFFLLSLVLFCVGIIFAMIGLVYGLTAMQVPQWATYLGLGVLTVAVGVVIFKVKTE